MEKSKTFLRAAGILMGATMLTTCVLGGTLAKYATDSGKLAADGTIAKWKVNVNGADITKLSGKIDLFDAVFDTATSDPSLLGAGQPDDEIKEANMIAPGTWGDCSMEIENASDVDANIAVTLEKDTSNNLPLQFSTNGDSWSDDLTTVLSGFDTNFEAGQTKTVNLLWKWDFDASGEDTNDSRDTAIGTAANDSAEKSILDVTITATQKD